MTLDELYLYSSSLTVIATRAYMSYYYSSYQTQKQHVSID